MGGGLINFIGEGLGLSIFFFFFFFKKHPHKTTYIYLSVYNFTLQVWKGYKFFARFLLRRKFPSFPNVSRECKHFILETFLVPCPNQQVKRIFLYQTHFVFVCLVAWMRVSWCPHVWHVERPLAGLCSLRHRKVLHHRLLTRLVMPDHIRAQAHILHHHHPTFDITWPLKLPSSFRHLF